MTEKLLSVLMPIYNNEKYLSQTIKSVCSAVSKENEHAVEFVFIDDGSTDNTPEILRQMQEKYKFKYIVRENKGVMATTNELVSLAVGKYIYLVDHDDLIAEKGIDKILTYLQKHEDVDVLFFDFKSFFDNEIENAKYHDTGWDFNPCDGQSVFAALTKSNMWHPPLWNKVIARQCIIDNNVFANEKLIYGDFEYSPRLMSFAKNVGYMHEAIYLWRAQQTSLSHSTNGNKKFGLIAIEAIDSLLLFLRHSKHLSKEFIDALYIKLGDSCWSVFSNVITADGINEELVAKLDGHKDLLKYSMKFNRKYIYRPLVCLLGIKRFCKLRYRNV